MSNDSHRRFLERAALREAQKAFRSRDGVRKEDFFALRVQTVEPWKRLAAFVVGLLFVGMTGWAFNEGFDAWAIFVFGAIALVFLVVGVVGRRKPVEGVLDATADAVFQRLLDALF